MSTVLVSDLLQNHVLSVRGNDKWPSGLDNDAQLTAVSHSDMCDFYVYETIYFRVLIVPILVWL